MILLNDNFDQISQHYIETESQLFINLIDVSVNNEGKVYMTFANYGEDGKMDKKVNKKKVPNYSYEVHEISVGGKVRKFNLEYDN